MIGSTIGHYKIEAKVGEGGMGIVYKAQDTKLNRTVALKFLPDRVQQDADAKARFIQEAQAAAGLNHPNICTIHGVEEHDGSVYMVMEFVEGGTLRSKIPFKSQDDAITTATQIGEALEEAHSKGIVHRDVKADNIMFTAKGQAKVMDFGLAKLKGALKLTRTSSTVGTLGYMAPEQIQGGEVDHRSDIFSFGVLLFEMLTGKLPFRGEHEAAMVYSIVNEEPQDIAAIAPDLSPIVANAIQRCLEKDPNDRYQHFDDIVADLRRSQKKTSRISRGSSVLPPVSGTQPIPSGAMPASSAPDQVSKKLPLPLIGGGAGAVAVIALAVWLFSGPSLPQVNPNMDVSVMQIPATEYYYPGISPDGKWLTFPGADLNGTWDIYMMLIETGESKRVTSDSSLSLAGASIARFSPDGTMITYGRRDRATGVASVCVVSVLSGQVRVVADTGVSPRWDDAHSRIFYARLPGNAIYPSQSGHYEYWSVSPKGGDARLEYVDSLGKGSGSFFSFGVSPDGAKLLFTRNVADQTNEVFALDLATREEEQLTFDKKTVDEVVWSDNGYIFYTSNRAGNFNIWALPEDGGDAIQITKGAGPDNGLTYSTAANRMVFSQRTLVATAWIANADGSGNRQLYPEDNILESHISPDGKTLALRVSHPTLLPTLMLRDMSGGNLELLFPHDSTVGLDNPLWSPDGKLLSYFEYREGSAESLRAKVLDIAGGRRVRDLGAGIPRQWFTDSTLMISRDTTGSRENPRYDFPKRLNLNTGEEIINTLDTANAWKVLNGTMIAYVGTDGVYIVRPEEYDRKPNQGGRLVVRFSDAFFGRTTDSFVYYRSADRSGLWRIDYRTLKRTKITDLRPADNISMEFLDYNDKLVTYSIRNTKTNIVRVDNVFVKD